MTFTCNSKAQFYPLCTHFIKRRSAWCTHENARRGRVREGAALRREQQRSAPLPGDFFGYFLVRTQESNTTPEGVFRYKANLFLTLLRESDGLPTNLQVPVAARAYLSCPGKKGSKEAGWGGFELCAPAHKSHLPKTPPGAHFRWCTIVFRSTLGSTIKATAPILRG